MAVERHYHDRRMAMLLNERSSWDAHWRELASNFQPRMGRFFVADRNKGQKRHNLIYDNTPTRAVRVLGAGMMGGMTSPARPWFRLTTADPELAEDHEVKEWLSDVRRMMLDVFARSNTYPMLQSIYEELAIFGTAANIQVGDFDKVIHHHPQTIGEYAVATDDRNMVNALYREFDMTVGAVVQRYGLDACSNTVKAMYRRGMLDNWVTLHHAIEPRRERDPNMRNAVNMPFASCTWEKGADSGKYLLKSGMKRFRALCPRWNTAGRDIYGYSPGMEALGDAKQLQFEQLRKAQGIDYQTRPPVILPSTIRGTPQLVPGGVSYYDGPAQQSATQAFASSLNLSYLLEDIRDVRERVNAAFYVDIFLMLSQSMDNPSMTATEVAERHEEKLLMLGPVLERLHSELLDPLIALTFEDMIEAGILPPPPEALDGQPIRVEFVSMLAQAQRAVGLSASDRFISNLGVIASMKPDVIDKFDADKWADLTSDALGIDPELVVASDKVALVREQRAAAQQQAEQMAQAEQMSKTAQNLGNTPTGAIGNEGNALNDVMNMFSGYNSPSAETY